MQPVVRVFVRFGVVLSVVAIAFSTLVSSAPEVGAAPAGPAAYGYVLLDSGGGLYLFKAPATVSSSPSQDVTQPTQSAPADPLKSTLDAKPSGAGINGNREVPTTAAKTVTKQNN